MLFDLKLSLAITAIKALQVHSLSAELMRRSLEKMILTQGSAPGRSFRSHFVSNKKDGEKTSQELRMLSLSLFIQGSQ